MDSRRTLRDDAGSALIELAVALPLLVLILVATVDFARVFYMGIELQNAARAGAQWGAHSPGQSANFAGIQTTAQNSVNIPGVVAVATRLCECATDTGTFSATTPANTCTATCSTGSHMVITVTVTTAKTFTTVMSGFPGLPNSVSLVRGATLRVVN